MPTKSMEENKDSMFSRNLTGAGNLENPVMGRKIFVVRAELAVNNIPKKQYLI